MNLSELIRVYPEAVDVSSCANIIQAFDALSPAPYRTDLFHFDQLNVNSSLPAVAHQFAHIVNAIAKQYFRDVGVDQFISPQGFEHVRIKKYVKGEGEFRPHIDVADIASAKRYLIAMLYLNDNNGATTFPNLGISIKPTAGTMVLFLPMWMFPHAGTMPTDVDKYIMMTSLTYT